MLPLVLDGVHRSPKRTLIRERALDRIPEKFDTGRSELVDGARQVPYGEADDRSGLEVLLADVSRTKDFDLVCVWQLEDPEVGLGMDARQSEHFLVEPGELLSTRLTRPDPAFLGLWRHP